MKRVEPSRIIVLTRKKVKFDAVCFPFVLERKMKKKIYFFSVNTKNISSHVLKISEISLVLSTREFTDICITFNEYIWYSPQKSKYPLCKLCANNIPVWFIVHFYSLSKGIEFSSIYSLTRSTRLE